MPKQRTVIEDPSIAYTARLEAARLFAAVEQLYIEGKPFFHAREIVLSREYDGMASRYGAEVAKRATHAVMCTGPVDMGKEALEAGYQSELIYWGLDRKLSRFDCWCIKWFGGPVW